MNISYCISINGQRAVDLGYKFQNGSCYRGIYNHGKRLGQLEVVIDEPGEYNGYSEKWVDVSYIEHKNIDAVLKQLKRLGFSGCFAVLSESHENNGYCTEKTIKEFTL